MVWDVLVLDEKEISLLKIVIAKKLNDSMSQNSISKHLNLTQPMVSHFINNEEKISPKTIELGEKISTKILRGESIFFRNVVSFKEIKDTECVIGSADEFITDDRMAVISNLQNAYLILKDKNFQRVLPQIKVNIAMICKDDVGSFSNGLVVINDRIAMHSDIVFGKSKHLSELLLKIKAKNPQINAIMNLKYCEYKLKSFKMSKSYGLDDFDNENVLLHEGNFGIEPCAYVIGYDAIDVAKKVLRLI